MSNPYYTHVTYPAPNAPGSSAALRNELDLVTAGFDKLPTLSGNGNKVVVINSGGTAMTSTVSLSGLTLNSTTIGATTPASGAFTTLSASGAVSLGSSVTIAGGTINGTQIGNTTPSSGAFTTLSASSGVTGNLTGNVTGNLTGNVTAGSGTSTFNNVTVNGTLDMASATVSTISGLLAPTNSDDAANKGYVDTQDALRLALTGGTMSGAIAMGSNKITGMGTPTASGDAATKGYVDTQDALRLALTGGTMSGAIAMGSNKITGMADPTQAQDAATKNYIDVLYGSTASAAASAAAAAASEINAANSASSALTYSNNAQSSANSAAASYDAFDDRYLGAKAVDPTVDNDGNPLLTGALYWNTVSSIMKVYTGSAWVATYLPASGYLQLSGGTMTGAITFAGGQTWPTFNQNTTGNAATATALETARNINGVSFNGTADITVADSTKLPLAGGTMTGDLTLNAQSDLRFADSDSSNWVAFQAPATVASNVTWTLPNADGSPNQVLKTDGSGALGWSTIAASQWNTSGSDINYTAGRVSIGTATPAYGPLHVHQNSTNNTYIQLSNNSTGATSGDGVSLIVGGAGEAGNTDFIIQQRETAAVTIFTSSTRRFTIDSGGAFGLGSGPSYGTSGQLLTSAGTGAPPTWSTLTAGTGISVTSGAGSITVASTVSTAGSNIYLATNFGGF